MFPQGAGLMKLDASQSRDLALDCTFGGTSSLALGFPVAGETRCTALVPLSLDMGSPPCMNQEQSYGIVLLAALGSSPALPLGEDADSPDFKLGSGVHKGSSPRRTQPVKFTCNICKTETIRVVNPHAWKHGTVFLECSGCNIKHKAVDNLNLFHELSGPVFSKEESLQRLRKNLEDSWNLGSMEEEP